MAGETRAVVDSTVFAAIFLREPGFEVLADRLGRLRRVRTAPFFRFEVANALWKHRKLPVEDAEAAMDALWRLPVDDSFGGEAARETLRVARARGQAFYACAFVVLARREGFPLWTLDRRQAAIAREEGVILVP